MIAPTYRPGHLAEMAMEDDGKLLACDSRADLIFQFDTRKRELLKSWPARGDGAGDMSLDRAHHRLFVGTRVPPEMTVYDSQSGREIASLAGPETMDGVHYDCRTATNLHLGRPLVRNARSLARLALCVSAKRRRPLPARLKDHDPPGARAISPDDVRANAGQSPLGCIAKRSHAGGCDRASARGLRCVPGGR